MGGESSGLCGRGKCLGMGFESLRRWAWKVLGYGLGYGRGKVRGNFEGMWAWKVRGKFEGMWAWKKRGKFGGKGFESARKVWGMWAWKVHGKFGCGVNKRKAG